MPPLWTRRVLSPLFSPKMTVIQSLPLSFGETLTVWRDVVEHSASGVPCLSSFTGEGDDFFFKKKERCRSSPYKLTFALSAVNSRTSQFGKLNRTDITRNCTFDQLNLSVAVASCRIVHTHTNTPEALWRHRVLTKSWPLQPPASRHYTRRNANNKMYTTVRSATIYITI